MCNQRYDKIMLSDYSLLISLKIVMYLLNMIPSKIVIRYRLSNHYKKSCKK